MFKKIFGHYIECHPSVALCIGNAGWIKSSHNAFLLKTLFTVLALFDSPTDSDILKMTNKIHISTSFSTAMWRSNVQNVTRHTESKTDWIETLKVALLQQLTFNKFNRICT